LCKIFTQGKEKEINENQMVFTDELKRNGLFQEKKMIFRKNGIYP
jgi:hypothetical protein